MEVWDKFHFYEILFSSVWKFMHISCLTNSLEFIKGIYNYESCSTTSH